jgi:sulfonate transport system ATP-binding protein
MKYPQQLDIELRYKLEDELIKLWKKINTTIIFITHNIEEAVYMSENILVLTNKPAKIKDKIENNLDRPRRVSDHVAGLFIIPKCFLK